MAAPLRQVKPPAFQVVSRLVERAVVWYFHSTASSMKPILRKAIVLLVWNVLCLALGAAAFLQFGKNGCFWTLLACLVVPFVVTPNPPNEDGAREDRTVVLAVGTVLLALLAPRFAASPWIAAALGLVPGLIAGRLILILTRSRREWAPLLIRGERNVSPEMVLRLPAQRRFLRLCLGVQEDDLWMTRTKWVWPDPPLLRTGLWPTVYRRQNNSAYGVIFPGGNGLSIPR